MKTRPHFVTMATLLALVCHSLGSLPASADEPGDAPEQVQAPGSLFELLIGNRRGPRPELQTIDTATETMAEGQPPARHGNPLGRLFTRWPARRPAGRSGDSPDSARQQPSPGRAAASTDHESDLSADVDFPVFRSDAAPPERMSQASAVPPEAPEASTTVLTSHEAHADEPPPTKVKLRPGKEIAKPLPTTPAPSRSTSAYLADQVRFGHVARKPQVAPAIERTFDPPAAVLEELRDASPLRAKAAQEKLDAVLSSDDAPRGPAALPLEPEDVTALRAPLPVSSASFSGLVADPDRSAEQARVSSAASPAALQQALRQFGAVIASEDLNQAGAPNQTEAHSPQRSDSSQRSRLSQGGGTVGIDALRKAADDANRDERDYRPAAGQTCHGEVKGVDRRSGTIVLTFYDDCLPMVGSRVRVHQRLLFKNVLLGEFEVVGIDQQAVIARPVGKVDLEQILPADEAVAF